MKQIQHSAWLPDSPAPDSRAAPAGKSSLFSPRNKSFISLLTKLVRSRWPNIGLVFCVFLLTETKRTWPISSHLDLTFGQQRMSISTFKVNVPILENKLSTFKPVNADTSMNRIPESWAKSWASFRKTTTKKKDRYCCQTEAQRSHFDYFFSNSLKAIREKKSLEQKNAARNLEYASNKIGWVAARWGAHSRPWEKCHAVVL